MERYFWNTCRRDQWKIQAEGASGTGRREQRRRKLKSFSACNLLTAVVTCALLPAFCTSHILVFNKATRPLGADTRAVLIFSELFIVLGIQFWDPTSSGARSYGGSQRTALSLTMMEPQSFKSSTAITPRHDTAESTSNLLALYSIYPYHTQLSFSFVVKTGINKFPRKRTIWIDCWNVWPSFDYFVSPSCSWHAWNGIYAIATARNVTQLWYGKMRVRQLCWGLKALRFSQVGCVRSL